MAKFLLGKIMSPTEDSKSRETPSIMNRSKLTRISHEEKLNLANLLQELSSFELTKVVNFIKSKIPRCFQDQDRAGPRIVLDYVPKRSYQDLLIQIQKSKDLKRQKTEISAEAQKA